MKRMTLILVLISVASLHAEQGDVGYDPDEHKDGKTGYSHIDNKPTFEGRVATAIQKLHANGDREANLRRIVKVLGAEVAKAKKELADGGAEP